RVALATTATAAWILAHTRSGSTVVSGRDADMLASVPLSALELLPDISLTPEAPLRRRTARARHYRMAPGPKRNETSNVKLQTSKLAVAIIERWGIHTLGQLAGLPRADLHTRLGPIGIRLHQAACGEDA